MRYFSVKPAGEPHQPPGTPFHTGSPKEETVTIDILDYSNTHYSETQPEKAEECAQFKQKDSVSWINVNGVHNVELLESLGESFGLHPLVLEDIAHTGQRAKCESYDEYVYFVGKMLTYDEEEDELQSEQVSFVLGKGFVISFQEETGDVFDPVRERIRRNKGRIRKMGADYLAYSLLDSMVDGYFTVLEILGELGEDFQEQVLQDPRQNVVRKIHSLKRQLIAFRRTVWPLREAMRTFQQDDTPLVGDKTRPYLRDLYDHIIQVLDTVEVFRELVSSTMDLYMNSLSNRMNEVMKVLTVMASIFIPMTFLAGIYGMNFEYMPELQWQWGYPAVWFLMCLIALGMLIFFRKKDWI